jgi:hypothetical protein
MWGSNADVSRVCVRLTAAGRDEHASCYPYKGKGRQEVSPGCRVYLARLNRQEVERDLIAHSYSAMVRRFIQYCDSTQINPYTPGS